MKEVRKISKENTPIRQHHVPEVYLKNFCNSSKAIAVLDKTNKRVFSTGIRAVGVEKNFYTLDKLEDPYYWEHIYATGIEPLMGKLISTVISHSNPLVRNGATILSYSEKVQLAFIMVMQLLRGKQLREYEHRFYQDYLPDAFKLAKEKFGLLSDEANRLLQVFSDDEYYFKQAAMGVAFDSKRIVQYIEILCSHRFILYRIKGNSEFITSDNPVMFLNRWTGNARPFANGLAQITTDVYYPIAPKLLLYIVHPVHFYGENLKKDGCVVDLISTTESNFISAINKKQVEQCYQHAFAQSEDVLTNILN